MRQREVFGPQCILLIQWITVTENPEMGDFDGPKGMVDLVESGVKRCSLNEQILEQIRNRGVEDGTNGRNISDGCVRVTGGVWNFRSSYCSGPLVPRYQ